VLLLQLLLLLLLCPGACQHVSAMTSTLCYLLPCPSTGSAATADRLSYQIVTPSITVHWERKGELSACSSNPY
jgi:hypothetical protein